MTNFINLLTVSRIILGPIIFLSIFANYYWLAVMLFFYAAFTDYLDGYMARKYNSVSEIGEILDPIADKILVVFLFFAISVSLSSFYIALCSSFIIAREIWVGALRDFNSRNSKLAATKVTFLAKIKTTVQLFTIGFYLLGMTFNNSLVLVIADIFLLISFFITLHTGYIYTYNSFKKNN